jgi:hypothetical protein
LFFAGLVADAWCHVHARAPERHALCLGLGCFSEDRVARLQLGFFLAMAELLAIPLGCCRVYDPAFVPVEVQALQLLGLTVPAANRVGAELCPAACLVFMPHCPARLYEEVLRCNWARLDGLLLVGNSLASYEDRRPPLERTLPCVAAYLSLLAPVAHLPDYRPLDRAFNDLALHWLPSTQRGLWPASPPEPPSAAEADLAEVVLP